MASDPSANARLEAWMPGFYDCLHDLASRALSRE